MDTNWNTEKWSYQERLAYCQIGQTSANVTKGDCRSSSFYKLQKITWYSPCSLQGSCAGQSPEVPTNLNYSVILLRMNMSGLKIRNPGEASHLHWELKYLHSVLLRSAVFLHRVDFMRNRTTTFSLCLSVSLKVIILIFISNISAQLLVKKTSNKQMN